MKAILVNGIPRTFDDAAAEQRHMQILQQYQITDDIISSIQSKQIDALTEDDIKRLNARKQFDTDWQQMLEGYANYKTLLHDEQPNVTGLQFCNCIYEELDDCIIGHWQIVDNHSPLVDDEIARLKKELASTDYIIVKTYEARILDEPEPYANLADIVNTRKALRARINELECCERDIILNARTDM